jgi:RNA polymerase sigma factor (sigma-70 family)
MTVASPQAVFLEHESWLRTVVRSRLSEPEAIEDVMQNIALAIVRQREALDEIGRVGAWLYQIAVRQVLMYRRTTGRRRNFRQRLASVQDPLTAGVSDEASPVDSLVAMEQREFVRKALDELSELDRQILLLKYSEGWTYRQLSEHLGVKEDTVEYRLMKARRNLRRHLRSYAEEGLQSCN